MPAVDLVLTASRPTLAAADALEAARSLFGVAATGARDLGSERDRTFALDDRAGRPVAILKVANPSEDPAVLDMEEAVRGVSPRHRRRPRADGGGAVARMRSRRPRAGPAGRRSERAARSMARLLMRSIGSASTTSCLAAAGSTPPR